MVIPGAYVSIAVTKTATLRLLRDRFLATHASSHEKKALHTAGTHFSHLTATLGEAFPLAELAQADLQRYFGCCCSSGIAPVTIQREINGFLAAWNWGKRSRGARTSLA